MNRLSTHLDVLSDIISGTFEHHMWHHNFKQTQDQISVIQTSVLYRLSNDILHLSDILRKPQIYIDAIYVEEAAEVCVQLLCPKMNLFSKLAQNICSFEYKTKPKIAHILNYIIRCESKYHLSEYIEVHTDTNGNNIIIGSLLSHLYHGKSATFISAILQEMVKRQKLSEMLLHHTKIAAVHRKTNGSTHIVDELIMIAMNPSSKNTICDTHKTLQLLLTQNTDSVSKYLQNNRVLFFFQLNELIQSDEWRRKRLFLGLLRELLFEKKNFHTMIWYISQKEHLKMMMLDLKNSYKPVAFAAFHLFKLFVANPRKASDIQIILWKNKEKIVKFLQTFLIDKTEEDEVFASEKQLIIKHMKELTIPQSVNQYKQSQQIP